MLMNCRTQLQRTRAFGFWREQSQAEHTPTATKASSMYATVLTQLQHAKALVQISWCAGKGPGLLHQLSYSKYKRPVQQHIMQGRTDSPHRVTISYVGILQGSKKMQQMR